MDRPDDAEGMDDVDDLDEYAWPEALLDAGEARRWIASILPGAPAVIGPTAIYQAKEWGVTARFAVAATAGDLDASDLPTEVVFKASCLPLFAAAPALYDLLWRHCAEAVPHPLASAMRGDCACTLFQPFDGPTVAAVGELAPLLALARTLAHIQANMAVLPASETAGLPHTPVERMPELFEAVLRDVRERYLALWDGEGSELAAQFRLPPDLPAQMEAHRESVARWTAELLAGEWPTSIDHVDLHDDNAVIQPDGDILIYDWEEATLGCPFFSLDRLLDDARVLDGAAPLTAGDTPPLITPSELALRAAYQDALPWGTPSGRERALDLALCVAPIKTAYEGILLAEALGWEEGMPHIAAWALGRALARWRAMDGLEDGA
jgi:hypothetical protein